MLLVTVSFLNILFILFLRLFIYFFITVLDVAQEHKTYNEEKMSLSHRTKKSLIPFIKSALHDHLDADLPPTGLHVLLVLSFFKCNTKGRQLNEWCYLSLWLLLHSSGKNNTIK